MSQFNGCSLHIQQLATAKLYRKYHNIVIECCSILAAAIVLDLYVFPNVTKLTSFWKGVCYQGKGHAGIAEMWYGHVGATIRG